MKLSKEQYNSLPNEYKKYFIEIGGDVSSDEQSISRNVHPT